MTGWVNHDIIVDETAKGIGVVKSDGITRGHGLAPVFWARLEMGDAIAL